MAAYKTEADMFSSLKKGYLVGRGPFEALATGNTLMAGAYHEKGKFDKLLFRMRFLLLSSVYG